VASVVSRCIDFSDVEFYSITANSALMRLRKSSYPRSRSTIRKSGDAGHTCRLLSGAGGAALEPELQHEMEEAIQSLPPEFRQVFVLRDLEESRTRRWRKSSIFRSRP